jgi:hypothetical protein
MVIHRPNIVIMLAFLAGLATAIAGYKLLIYLGIIPPSLGVLSLFGSNVLGVLATGIKLVVLAATTYGLWTMRPWGWLLALIVSIYGLTLAVLEALSGTSVYLISADVLVYLLALLGVLSPQVRNAFAAVEKQRKAGA